MTPFWLTRVARAVGFGRSKRALPFRPAWFDAAYLTPVDPPSKAHRHDGRSFSEHERAAAWAQARPIVGWDPQDWRVDHLGNTLFRHHYDDGESAFGWRVARIDAEGGEDAANLRAELWARPHAPRFERALDMDRFAR